MPTLDHHTGTEHDAGRYDRYDTDAEVAERDYPPPPRVDPLTHSPARLAPRTGRALPCPRPQPRGGRRAHAQRWSRMGDTGVGSAA
jgi:hypothetical protein